MLMVSGMVITGISAGGLDDNAALLEETLSLGVVDHSLGDPVLYASCGIEVFKLCEHLCAQFVLLLKACEFEEGSASDEVCDLLKNFHDNISFTEKIIFLKTEK